MHRRSILALAAASATLAVAPRIAAAAARQGGWKTILDARSGLKGWTQVGKGEWTIAEGAVQSIAGASWLVSDGTYGDFELKAEVWVSDDANSGINIRCTNPMQIAPGNCYEVNLYDQRADPSYGTGSLVGIAKVSPMPKAGGKWNVMEIAARGDHFRITLNGQVTVPDAVNGDHAHGRIALQGGAGTVKFRKVQIREL